MSLLVRISFILLGITFSSQARAAVSPVVKELQKRKYFRRATCGEFANYILRQNSLPLLSKTAPVGEGTRDSIDRKKETSRLPEFTDGLTSKQAGRSVKISAQGESNKRSWSLTLTRSMESKVKTETRFIFDVAAVENRQHCEFKGLEFSSTVNGKTSKHLVRPIDCLNTFSAQATHLEPSAYLAQPALLKDCSSGIRYTSRWNEIK